jgi:hypothetical protein
MRRLELTPRTIGRTELGQRGPGITSCQQDGAGGLSRERVQIRGVELRGNPGQLIGSRARCHLVFGLEQALDAGGEQPRARERILGFVERTADRRQSEIDSPMRQAERPLGRQAVGESHRHAARR